MYHYRIFINKKLKRIKMRDVVVNNIECGIVDRFTVKKSFLYEK